jgi:ABC-type antimicrobial peptide transport system permease subunit
MLGIPLKYNVRNLFVRRVTTTLTVLGIGLVVAVFLCVMALGEGISKVFTTSGSDRNVLVLRQNSQSELQSGIGLDQVPLVLTLSGIEKDSNGAPLASAELNIVLNLVKAEGGSSNVTLRGVQAKGMSLRPGMKLTEGRMFQPGMSEVIVSESVAKRFKNCAPGQTLRFGSYRWAVVGHFDAGGTAPDSEIWTDVDGMRNAFKRGGYSSVLARTTDRAGRDRFIAGLAGDARLALEGKVEKAYYDDQTSTAAPIRFFGIFVGVIMAIGACFGAMNTMYAAVSARTREIATLRALGFSRLQVLASFVFESVVLALLGGIVGCALGFLAVKLALSGVTGTTNFATFAEVVFAFQLTPALLVTGILFSVVMGFFGGLLPASRAAFTKITDALRQVG